MFLESIEYTATLIEYVARQTGCSVSYIANTLGYIRVYNLCHNAPMNRLLPIKKIGMEVISDNYLPPNSFSDALSVDFQYGAEVARQVATLTNDKKEYVDKLFVILTEGRGLINEMEN